MADEQEKSCCGNCAHFRRNPQTIGVGVCWCLPPQVVPAVMPGSNVAGVLPVRPPVRVSDYCGQWHAPAQQPGADDAVPASIDPPGARASNG
jgi:hypothetical protein